MIRSTIGNTVIRLFNAKKEAEEVAILFSDTFSVREYESGFFFVNEKGFYDTDGNFMKYLSEGEKAKLIQISQKA